MYIGPILFAAISALLGALHMIAPDHWVPLTMVSLKEHYSRNRLVALSATIGLLHGLTSVLLSLLIVFIGILLPIYYIKVVSVILIAFVCAYILFNAMIESKSTEVIKASIFVSVFPDLAVLPIIFYSLKFGTVFLSSISIIYITSSTFSIVSVVLLSNYGFSSALSKISPRYFDYVMVAVLALTAVYIYLFS